MTFLRFCFRIDVYEMTSSLRLGLNVKNNSEQRAACANSGKEQHMLFVTSLCVRLIISKSSTFPQVQIGATICSTNRRLWCCRSVCPPQLQARAGSGCPQAVRANNGTGWCLSCRGSVRNNPSGVKTEG